MAGGITINSNQPAKFGKTRSVRHRVEHKFRDILAEKMTQHLPDVIDAMISTAKGYETTSVAPDGKLVIKKDKPDVQAGKLLFEFSIEKPKQEVAHTGSMGIVHLIAQLEQDDNDNQN